MLDFRTEFSEVRIPRSTASDPARDREVRSTARHSAPRGEDADVGDLTRVVEQMHHCMPKAS